MLQIRMYTVHYAPQMSHSVTKNAMYSYSVGGCSTQARCWLKPRHLIVFNSVTLAVIDPYHWQNFVCFFLNVPHIGGAFLVHTVVVLAGTGESMFFIGCSKHGWVRSTICYPQNHHRFVFSKMRGRTKRKTRSGESHLFTLQNPPWLDV